MKWLWALVALALAQSVGAHGRFRVHRRKAPRAPDANAVLSKKLEVENKALRKQNEQLAAMMQMARAEVHRMDAAAAKSSRHRRGAKSCEDSEVLKQEIQDLRKKMQTMESDKSDLVQTLRGMLSKNSTKIFQRQAERAQQMNVDLEMRAGQERQALEAQIQEANGKVKEANEKVDATKDVAQGLQEDNEELRTKLQDVQDKLAKVEKVNKELSSDKANLVTTMQALMRENSRFKHGLEKETALENKEEKELVSDKAILAKLNKKAAPPAPKKQPKRLLKVSPRHHKHEETKAAEMAHLKTINRYIDSAETSTDDDEDAADQQLSAVQKQEELFRKGKVGTHLSDWLGFKTTAAQSSDAGSSTDTATTVQKEKAVENDGGEAEAEALVKEAKANLEEMERQMQQS